MIKKQTRHVSLLLALFSSLSALCALNLGKMNLQTAVIHNKTDRELTIEVHCDAEHQRHGRVPMSIPFTIAPGAMTMVNPHNHTSSSHAIYITNIISPQTPLLQQATSFNNHGIRIITLEDMPSDLAATPFSFIPAAVDFRASLNVDDGRYNEVLQGRLNYSRATAPRSTAEFLDFLKNNFDSYKEAMRMPDAQPRIPLIIHHIWFGSPFPEQFIGWYEGFIKMHPNWQHILWTDQATPLIKRFVDTYPNYREMNYKEVGTLQNQTLFDEAKNYGEKADIFRLEALYRLGGLYVDIDFECFEPFDILHHTYDFYGGVLPLDTGLLTVNNGLIGSRAQHPILQQAINCLESSKNINRFHYFAIICATGPIPLTRAIWAKANQDRNRDIIFPCSYFYPLPYRKGHLEKHVDIKPETFSVHYCTKTWARASAHQS